MIPLKPTPLAMKRILIHRRRVFTPRNQRRWQRAAARINRCVETWLIGMNLEFRQASAEFAEAVNHDRAIAHRDWLLPDVRIAALLRDRALAELVQRGKLVTRQSNSVKKAEQLARPYVERKALARFAAGRKALILRELQARAEEFAASIQRRGKRLASRQGGNA